MKDEITLVKSILKLNLQKYILNTNKNKHGQSYDVEKAAGIICIYPQKHKYKV